MLYFKKQLYTAIKEELESLGIQGVILGSSLIYNQHNLLIRITINLKEVPKQSSKIYKIVKVTYTDTIYHIYLVTDLFLDIENNNQLNYGNIYSNRQN